VFGMRRSSCRNGRCRDFLVVGQRRADESIRSPAEPKSSAVNRAKLLIPPPCTTFEGRGTHVEISHGVILLSPSHERAFECVP